MAYTYILRLSNLSYYVGSCRDLKIRIEQHKKGYVKSTRKKRPIKLMYAKFFKTYSSATIEEFRIKRWKKRKSIENLIKYDKDNLIPGPDIG